MFEHAHVSSMEEISFSEDECGRRKQRATIDQIFIVKNKFSSKDTHFLKMLKNVLILIDYGNKIV